MKYRVFAWIFLFLLPLAVFSQIVKPDEEFTDVHTFGGKVVFLKEIQLKDALAVKNYQLLKDWVKKEYAADPFNSSVNYDDKNRRATAVSRVQLVLSEREDGSKETIIMKYRLDAFIKDDLCIMEVSNISYINNPKENKNTLRDKISAEDMITNAALQLDDANRKVRSSTRDNTLHFLNSLAKELQKIFND